MTRSRMSQMLRAHAARTLRLRRLLSTSLARQLGAPSVSVDADEIARFSALATQWIDESGPLKALHSFNRVRIPWIVDELQKVRCFVPNFFFYVLLVLAKRLKLDAFAAAQRQKHFGCWLWRRYFIASACTTRFFFSSAPNAFPLIAAV